MIIKPIQPILESDSITEKVNELIQHLNWLLEDMANLNNIVYGASGEPEKSHLDS